MSRLGSIGARKLFCLAGLVSVQALACSREPPKTVHSAVRPAASVEPTPASDNDALVVGETIRRKCSLPETASNSPQFDFDEAALRPRGESILDSIAICITTGSMKGEGLTITGHTDPRGTAEYNQGLGMLRANAARQYLEGRGVASVQMTVRSRGEQDAVGETEENFQLDRRVEIDETSASP